MASVLQSAQVSFGNIFDVLPKASVVNTGFERVTLKGQVNYGWTAAVNSVTTSGATVTLNTLINFNYVRLKCVATQGDHLQVYYLETKKNSRGQTYGISFDYPSLVEFDSTRPPNDVFLAIEIAGYQF